MRHSEGQSVSVDVDGCCAQDTHLSWICRLVEQVCRLSCVMSSVEVRLTGSYSLHASAGTMPVVATGLHNSLDIDNVEALSPRCVARLADQAYESIRARRLTDPPKLEQGPPTSGVPPSSIIIQQSPERLVRGPLIAASREL